MLDLYLLPRCLLRAVFALLLCIAATLPAHALTFGDFSYTATATEATITGYTGAGGVVSIPGTINDLAVTGIGSSAFQSKTSLTSIIIPSSVISIGEGAFNGCTQLASVSIPTSVTSIGDGAFRSCTSATSITIPSSVTSIGSFAFLACSSLTKITIPSSVISIGEGAINGCKNLNAITVDPGNSNFSSLSGVLFDKNQTTLISHPANKPVTAYSIPSSVTSIGNAAFDGCIRLTSITTTSSVTNIGSAAFQGCIQLTSVSIPSSVSSIGSSAFYGCTSLKSMTIPPSVTSIWHLTFSGCTQLASVSIPSTVTSIGHDAFNGCNNLQAVFFAGNPPTVGASVFSSGTIYYSFEANNWGATFAGRPTALALNPIIMSQPVSLSFNQGTTAIFSVVAMGSNSLSYQWEKNGLDISGATGATLELGNVQAADAGSYKVRVGSEWGSVTSNAANLTVVVLIAPPSIIRQASSIIANPGESAVFSVAATGSDLGYQWMRNGVLVAGATSSDLTFSAIQPVHVGTYAVVVTNGAGAITSASVSLTLNTVYSQAQYDVIAQAAHAEIISSPNSYGLYSLAQVQALHVGTPLLAKDPVSGKFKLTIGAKKSADLSTYTALPFSAGAATINALGEMEFQFTSPDNAAFFRLETH